MFHRRLVVVGGGGKLPGQSRDRVHGTGAHHVGGRAGPVVCGRGDSADRVGRIQFRILAAHQRSNTGDVSGRIAGANQRRQLLMLVRHTIGQPAVVAIADRHDALARRGDAHPWAGHGELRRLTAGVSEPTDSTYGCHQDGTETEVTPAQLRGSSGRPKSVSGLDSHAAPLAEPAAPLLPAAATITASLSTAA